MAEKRKSKQQIIEELAAMGGGIIAPSIENIPFLPPLENGSIPPSTANIQIAPKPTRRYQVEKAPINYAQETLRVPQKLAQRQVPDPSVETPPKPGEGLLNRAGKATAGVIDFLNRTRGDWARIAAGRAAEEGNIGLSEAYLGTAERIDAEQKAQRELEAKERADKARMEWDIKLKQMENALGRDLPAKQATDLANQQTALDMLDGMMKGAGDIKGLTYSPADKLKALNPYDTSAQSFQQLVATTKQVIGKGLEEGVLKKEDEDKYEKIIPKIGDTKEVLQKKGNQLRNMLSVKRNNTIKGLNQAGFNVSQFVPTKDLTYNIFNSKNKPIPKKTPITKQKIGNYTIEEIK